MTVNIEVLCCRFQEAQVLVGLRGVTYNSKTGRLGLTVSYFGSHRHIEDSQLATQALYPYCGCHAGNGEAESTYQLTATRKVPRRHHHGVGSSAQPLT